MSDVLVPRRVHRPARAAEKLGVSVATFYRLARTDPRFPRLHKLSERVTVVYDDELDAFISGSAKVAK